MTRSEVTYAARPDATPESELSALTSVYRLVIDHAMRKAAPDGRPKDEKERSKNDSLASTKYTG